MASDPLIAKTHPRAYMLHKYWARKPHNILSHYIETYFKKGQLVVDPFAGSGVFLAEAKKQGLDVIGIDVNPLATLLTEVTLNPPNPGDMKRELDAMIEIAQVHTKSFKTIEGETVRYLVHAMVSICSSCQHVNSAASAKKDGRKYVCTHCGERVFYNFNNFDKTEIIEIVTETGVIKRSSDTEEEFQRQEKMSTEHFGNNFTNYDKLLIENRRILAFAGMKSSDLFTNRNFSIASTFFAYAHSIKDESVRNAILLFLTSNIAQISRLIPYRNGLSTGGQAWTVPGFWIAPIHIEANPLKHLKSRATKFVNGINDLRKGYVHPVKISKSHNGDMRDVLNASAPLSVDGFFFDPPYGDSVPYLEFSFIWNVFLNKEINYDSEVIVSDRSAHVSKWDKYEKSIEESIGLMASRLKPDGKIVMTFNNLDPRAWKAILNAFKSHGLKCLQADYQVPAVVSSKAQFATDTSYVGDFYCVFVKDQNDSPDNGAEYILKYLIPLFIDRDGAAPQNVVKRTAILAILQENLDIKMFDSINDIIHGIAKKQAKNFVLRDEIWNKYKQDYGNNNLRDHLRMLAHEFLGEGRMSVKNFYVKVLERTHDHVLPAVQELEEILAGTVLFEGGYCYLQELPRGQLELRFK